MSPITTDLPIPQIVEAYPQTLMVFERYGLKNLNDYKAIQFETLLATAKVQQWDITQLLNDLNAVAADSMAAETSSSATS
ncbi:MAG: hypothetical protein VKK59_00930 [Vampirovibrionales bacterium]|nr:hypothetical protein [Vampirovibrionales bacterium]